MPGVAAAVLALADFVEALHDEVLGEISGSLETLKQVIALGVHVGGRNVGDLAGRAAQADSLIVYGGADPDRAAVVIELIRLPEPAMVPLPRVVADRLLEGQVLLAAKQ